MQELLVTIKLRMYININAESIRPGCPRKDDIKMKQRPILPFLLWLIPVFILSTGYTNFANGDDVILKQAAVEPTPSLLPRPKIYTPRPGTFSAPESLRYNTVPGLSPESIKLVLHNAFTLEETPVEKCQDANLQLVLTDTLPQSDSPQAYKLVIQTDRITISSPSSNGILMALHTLAQLALDAAFPCCEIIDSPHIKTRIAHITYCHVLESMPYNVPDFDALMQLIDRLASLKYNAVLLELTALFPYQKHSPVSCAIAFTPEQIRTLRDRLQLYHMEIIPFIQCLGHAYEVLRHEEYTPYRELSEQTQQYCPTNPRVVDLYMEFVDEWLRYFPDVKRWHIGADECRQLGQCPRCAAKLKQQGVSRLYVDHIAQVAERLHQKGITPLAWGDMLEHHPEALSALPRYLTLVYWNYRMPNFPRPYPVGKWLDAGFDIINACGIRFGAHGTELSVYYPIAARGIQNLIPRTYKDGLDQVLVCNWMKGSPHENTDFGYAMAADLCWDTSVTTADFENRYAAVTFGLNSSRICRAYYLLSLWLPYAEPVQNHMVDRLDRLNVSGLKFPEKWSTYTTAKKQPQVLADLKHAQEAAHKTLQLLHRIAPHCTRGQRQIDLLQMSAECINAKAQFALMLHEGFDLEQHKVSTEKFLNWCSRQPIVLRRWQNAQAKHLYLLSQSGFQPVVKLTNEMMFEKAEYDSLVEMGNRLAHKIVPGKTPEQVALKYLCNSGTPYQRGLEHGYVFKDDIQQLIQKYCPKTSTSPSPQEIKLQNRMLSYVSDRFPAVIAEMQGIAAGAEVSFDDIFRLNSFNAVRPLKNNSCCSTALVRGPDDFLHVLKTSDISPATRSPLLLRRVWDGQNDFYVIGWVGTLWVETAFTSQGLAVAVNSAPTEPNQTGSGIPQHFAVYPLLFGCQTVSEMKEKLTQTMLAGKGLIIGLADARGSAAIVEKSGTLQAIFDLSKDVPGIIATNRFNAPSLQPFNASRGAKSLANCQAREQNFSHWLSRQNKNWTENLPPDQKSPTRTRFFNAIKIFSAFLADTTGPGALCQTGKKTQIGTTEFAVILSPAYNKFQLTGLPPSFQKYLTWDFLDQASPSDY